MVLLWFMALERLRVTCLGLTDMLGDVRQSVKKKDLFATKVFLGPL